MLHVSPRTGAKFRMQGFRPLCWPPSSGLTLSELSTTVKGKIHPSVTKAMYSYTDWALHHSRRCHLHRSWCELCSPELYSAAALAVTRFQPSVSCLVERILGRRKKKTSKRYIWVRKSWLTVSALNGIAIPDGITVSKIKIELQI